MLLVVSLVHDVDHTLGVGVTVVGGVWGTLIIIVNKKNVLTGVVDEDQTGSMVINCDLLLTVVDHGFVDGVGSLVWENASGETGNNLLNLELLGERKDVIVDGHVDSEEFEVGLHVSVKTADLGGQVDHVRGLVLLKDLKERVFTKY